MVFFALRPRLSHPRTLALVVAASGPPGCSDDSGSVADETSQPTETSSDSLTSDDADSTASDDSAAPTSCAGVTCPGAGGISRGTCFIDAQGFAACACDDLDETGVSCGTQLIPTADLQCLSTTEYCEHVNGWPCEDEDDQAYCLIGVTPGDCPDACLRFCSGCSTSCDPTRPFNLNLPPATCECPGAFTFDPESSKCLPDVGACNPVDPYPGARFDLQFEGATDFRIVGGTYDWTNQGPGSVTLFGQYGAPHCGTVRYTGGSKPPGSYSLASVSVQAQYDGITYTSNKAGVSGSFIVEQLEWCGDFDCTEIDVQIDGTLASATGETVAVTGSISGTF